jgi:L-asparaginase / beta-aspartyl-peptidase
MYRVFRVVDTLFHLAVAAAITIVTGVSMISDAQAQQEQPVAFAIHGGAGTILRGDMSPELEQEYRAKLTEALQAGYGVLQQNGSSLDAVEAAIRLLEDSPLFNAGKGAVLTNTGTAELDASIMDGRTRAAGAVARVTTVKNPITLARLVMEESQHVMLAGDGAEQFAQEHGLETVPNEYFHTERRRAQLERVQEAERQQKTVGEILEEENEAGVSSKYGTVGAVALDRMGNLAAGTSTGGMMNKRFGRVGDSPIIGAGTYADNETCAVSSTGHGEYFIRGVVAYDISAMVRYAGLSLTEAANAVIHERLTEMGGTGGVIALDRDGTIAMPFNTAGMYRGYVDTEGNVVVEIYRD